jgi:hypothetical protein
MLPFPTWKPETYPPSSSFPLFGAAPGQLPPQFKASQHLQAMMARNKPVQDILKDRANRDFPQHTPYRSVEPSEIDEMPALETVGDDPEPVPAEMPPYHRRDDDLMPQETGYQRIARQAETTGRVGMSIGEMAGHAITGSLALTGGILLGTGLGAASAASYIYGALPGGRSSSDDDEVTPPDTQPTVAQRRRETAGPVAERVQAIETQVQAQAQPQAQRAPEHYDISDRDEAPPPDPPTRRSSGRPGMGGFFGGLFGRPQATAFAY